jgi:hypothetical protein
MSDATIAFYGGNEQKDVCFIFGRQGRILTVVIARDGGVQQEPGTAPSLILMVCDAHRSFCELPIQVLHLGEIGGVAAMLLPGHSALISTIPV